MQDSGSGNTPLSPIEGQDKQAPLPPIGQSGAAQPISNTPTSGQTSSVADQVPDLPPITWTASSSISPQRSKKWYQIAAAIFSLVLVFVIVMVAIKRMELVSAITIAVLLIVMYIALVSSAKLPSRVVKYTVSGKGIDINDKLHPYSEFHSFGPTANSVWKSRHILARLTVRKSSTCWPTSYPWKKCPSGVLISSSATSSCKHAILAVREGCRSG